MLRRGRNARPHHFGKYYGGGLPLEASAARARWMERHDPTHLSINSGGTFNQNAISLAQLRRSLHILVSGTMYTAQPTRDSVLEAINDLSRYNAPAKPMEAAVC